MTDMFRYLEKYTGKYRVKSDYDLGTEDFPREDNGAIIEEFDELFIPTKKGIIKHTYRDNILCLYTDKLGQGRNVYREILAKYPKIEIEYEEIGQDVLIYFKDEDMSKIAKIVTPIISGAKIPWYSIKNLPKSPYVIPQADLDNLLSKISIEDRMEKAQFFRASNSLFEKIIQTKKGKRFNIVEEKRKSKLNNREFIHFIGLWNEYVKFIEVQFANRKET